MNLISWKTADSISWWNSRLHPWNDWRIWPILRSIFCRLERCSSDQDELWSWSGDFRTWTFEMMWNHHHKRWSDELYKKNENKINQICTILFGEARFCCLCFAAEYLCRMYKINAVTARPQQKNAKKLIIQLHRKRINIIWETFRKIYDNRDVKRKSYIKSSEESPFWMS